MTCILLSDFFEQPS